MHIIKLKKIKFSGSHDIVLLYNRRSPYGHKAVHSKENIAEVPSTYGKQLYEVYDSLSAEKQSLCGFRLNGILDLVNQKECGQKKLSNTTKNEVEKIIKEIKGGQEEEAYYVAIESIGGAHSADK
ncbi:hypothetical protein MFLAVUS_009492 [Mucor flavus]|uniref:Uncharacterized protein n=1 Tax=Mucor flavus TaxID=439312 RepID=A0ABP9ZA19_9FUNG